MYWINKSTREVKVECKFCKKEISFFLPKDILEKKEYPVPFRYVHGEPYHSVTIYLDKDLNIRSAEFGDSLAISCEILKNCADEGLIGSAEFREQALKSWISAFVTTINIFSPTREEIIETVGRVLGEKYAKFFISKEIEGTIYEFQTFWKAIDFGFVKKIVIKQDQIILDIADNFEVYYLPNMYRKFCFLTQGFLKVILEKSLGKVFSIKELQCIANGDSICQFLIKWD